MEKTMETTVMGYIWGLLQESILSFRANPGSV